jgi:hypothetical protein
MLGTSPPSTVPTRWDGAFSFHHPGNSCQATIIESLRDKAIRPQFILALLGFNPGKFRYIRYTL